MTRDLAFLGFEWDTGNWPKCAKHGLSKEHVESVFRTDPFIVPSQITSDETRYAVIGPTESGRRAFIAFTLRMHDGVVLIRPVSARYMHAKEIEFYDSIKSA